MELIRVVALHFVAGALVDARTNRIAQAAPIVKWMIGKYRAEVVSYCQRKRLACRECVMIRLLDIATGVALGRRSRKQHFHLAAAGLRKDGAIVAAYNDHRERVDWAHHAEARLCRKLTPFSTVAVVRVLADGSWAMARPCPSCQRCMRRVGVRKVYYSIGVGEYGVMRL